MGALSVAGQPADSSVSAKSRAFDGERLAVVASPFFPHRIVQKAMQILPGRSSRPSTASGSRSHSPGGKFCRDSNDEFIVIEVRQSRR